MRALFCSDPLAPRNPESAFEREVAAAKAAGVSVSLLDFDALVAGRLEDALLRIAPATPAETAVYRGWMLRPEQYAQLQGAAWAMGLRLVTSPAEYRTCHHLPGWYPLLEGETPRSVWLSAETPLTDARIDAALGQLGDAPAMVKDYVKSQKHYWAEACFIPSPADRDAARRVIARFLELQGESLEGGLVLRELVPLASLGKHPRSGMPLSVEFRIFFVDHRPALCTEYWEEARYGEARPPLEQFTALAARVPSRFFSMDVALLASGGWTVLELGDGQVSGIPETDPAALYTALLGLDRPELSPGSRG